VSLSGVDVVVRQNLVSAIVENPARLLVGATRMLLSRKHCRDLEMRSRTTLVRGRDKPHRDSLTVDERTSDTVRSRLLQSLRS
jgi:hypothetical protein